MMTTVRVVQVKCAGDIADPGAIVHRVLAVGGPYRVEFDTSVAYRLGDRLTLTLDPV